MCQHWLYVDHRLHYFSRDYFIRDWFSRDWFIRN